MIKAEKIIEAKPYYIICRFNNGEVKKLFVEPIILQQKNIFGAEKILDSQIFPLVKIGELGQLYWENIAQMKDEKGKIISCEYDMSPEFVYQNSLAIK